MMTEAQFREYWKALGDATWAAMRPDARGEAAAPFSATEFTPAAAETPPARDTSSTTSALSERAWAPTHRAPAPVRAFGFGTTARVHACLPHCTDPAHSIPLSDLCT